MLDDQIALLVLRHGQSEWNAIHRWQGSADSPLTDLGRRQAVGTADRLEHLGIDFVGPWSSDLGRAAETATIIADAIDIGPVVTDARLREAHAGEWQGMTPDEIDLAWPEYRADDRRPPSFEPFEQVLDRGLTALVEIAGAVDRCNAAEPSGRTGLVVAHSGLIRTIVRHLGSPDERIPNLGGVWLAVDPGSSAVRLDGVFDPGGIDLSGLDAPSEDPGPPSSA